MANWAGELAPEPDAIVTFESVLFCEEEEEVAEEGEGVLFAAVLVVVEGCVRYWEYCREGVADFVLFEETDEDCCV